MKDFVLLWIDSFLQTVQPRTNGTLHANQKNLAFFRKNFYVSQDKTLKNATGAATWNSFKTKHRCGYIIREWFGWGFFPTRLEYLSSLIKNAYNNKPLCKVMLNSSDKLRVKCVRIIYIYMYIHNLKILENTRKSWIFLELSCKAFAFKIIEWK